MNKYTFVKNKLQGYNESTSTYNVYLSVCNVTRHQRHIEATPAYNVPHLQYIYHAYIMAFICQAILSEIFMQ